MGRHAGGAQRLPCDRSDLTDLSPPDDPKRVRGDSFSSEPVERVERLLAGGDLHKCFDGRHDPAGYE